MRNFLFRIFSFFIPEIKILRDKDLSLSSIKSSTVNSEIDQASHLVSPYRITNSRIGKGTYLSEHAWVSMTEIGKYCSIGPNLLCGWGIHPTDGISTSPMFYSTRQQNNMTLSTVDKVEERKPIKIGNDVFIGANVTILDGITIGDGAVIGAGAIVSKDIPPYAIAVGSPIQVIKYRFPEDIRNDLLNIKWWDFTPEQLKDVEKYFFKIDAFIAKYATQPVE